MTRTLHRLLPAVGVLGVAALLAGGVLFNPLHREAFRDWDQHIAYAEAARSSLLDHRELPFWNPYPCGGIPLLAQPESRVLTPFFLLYLVLPTGVAMQWDIALHFLVAVLGMVLLLRQEQVPWTAALVGALVFGGSTFMVLHLAEGHTWILSVAYAPLVLAFYERGLDKLHWAAAAGLFLALIVFEGGIYPAPHLCLFLGLYAAGLSITRRSARPLLVLGVVFLISALLAAPKLLPLLSLMGRTPRHVDSMEVLSLRAILHALTDRNQALDRSFAWSYWPWHEQGHYVGILALVLAAVALLKADRRSLLLGAVGVFFALLAAGHFSSWAPWALLHHLPVFRSQHVPSRFLTLAVLAVAVLAARGATALLEERQFSRWRNVLALLLVLFVGADVLSARAGILGPLRCPMPSWPASAPTGDPLITLRRAPRIPVACGGYSALAPAVRAGVAIIDAYEPMCPRDRGLIGRMPGLLGKDESGYKGEAWLEGQGTVEIVSRTQHTLGLRVSPEASGPVILNMNWDPGWRSDAGSLSQDSQRRLVLALEPGQRTYALRYRPPYLWLSWGLWALGLMGAWALWRFRAAR